MAKKKPKKRKIKSKTEKSMRGNSAPEYFFFGLIFASALLLSFLSFESSREISTDFKTIQPSKANAQFQKEVTKLTKGYPIEKMSPHISRKNKRVASFLVAIAKKESNWGRHAPKKDGRECFNYWGYRGEENPTESGYSCFDSPQHAVKVVGGRISKLVAQKIDTPQEMIVWKCGSVNCARHDRGAAKWIWDVNSVYKKVYPTSKKSKEVALK